MLDDKLRAELDQCTAGIQETLPAIWWALFTGCKHQGFTEEQAFTILLTWIKETSGRQPTKE